MLGTSWRAFEVIQEGSLIDGMNIFTVRHLESIKLPGGSAGPVRISIKSFLNLLSRSKTFKQSSKQDSVPQKRQQKIYHGVFSV